MSTQFPVELATRPPGFAPSLASTFPVSVFMVPLCGAAGRAFRRCAWCRAPRSGPDRPASAPPATPPPLQTWFCVFTVRRMVGLHCVAASAGMPHHCAFAVDVLDHLGLGRGEALEHGARLFARGLLLHGGLQRRRALLGLGAQRREIPACMAGCCCCCGGAMPGIGMPAPSICAPRASVRPRQSVSRSTGNRRAWSSRSRQAFLFRSLAGHRGQGFIVQIRPQHGKVPGNHTRIRAAT